MDKHEMVSRLKDLALELGKTPNKNEFLRHTKFSDYALTKAFGTYTALILAADLEPYRVKKIDNSIFERDIEKHLEAYEPAPAKEQEKYLRCLFIPDVHFPFAHQPTLEKIYRFAEREQPDVIVQVGDLYDAYSHAKFPKSHNVYTPREETNLARKMAEEMWAELRRAAPKAKCKQLRGNHDDRPLKRILEVYPSAEDWIAEAVTKLMTFEGVETVLDSRDVLLLPGDVAVTHGFKSQLGQHRDAFLHNVVTGHLHVGGVSYRQLHGQIKWELNVGLAGDPASKGLSYTPSKIVNWTLGWGFLDEYGPRFIPGAA